MNRPQRTRVAGILSLALLSLLTACDDNEACRTDDDCDRDQVCSAEGSCTDEIVLQDTTAETDADTRTDTADDSGTDTATTDTDRRDTADSSETPDVRDTSNDVTDATDTAPDEDTRAVDTHSDEPDTGCGSTDTTDIAGNLVLHEATQTFDSGADLADSSLWLVDTSSLRAGTAGRDIALQLASCEEATREWGGGTTATSANWSFDDVATGDVSEGIAAVTDDATGQSGTFIATATDVASTPFGGAVADADTYAITERTERRLSFLAASDPDSGIGGSPGDLVAAGFLIVRFHDGSGSGVADVTVTADGSPVDGAIYPNDSFANATYGTDASTASHGVAFIPEASRADYSGTKSGRSFPSIETQSIPDLAMAVDFALQ